MNIVLYELEKKLGISDCEKCTDDEVEAIGRILAQGKPLPDGIFRDNGGKYHKFVGSDLSQEDKDRLVKYRILLEEMKIKRQMSIIILLLAIAVAVCIAITIVSVN